MSEFPLIVVALLALQFPESRDPVDNTLSVYSRVNVRDTLRWCLLKGSRGESD